MKSNLAISLVAGTIALALCQIASAHPGHIISGGFAGGVAHPLTGADHILAAIAVGLWTIQVRRGLWQMPAAFLGFMLAGAALAATGIALPMVEQGILASVLVLGLMVAAAARLPNSLMLPLVAVFASLHGFAHASEMAAGNAAAYTLGLTLATAAMIAASMALGLLAKHAASPNVVRLAGGAIAGAGALMILGIL